METQVRCAVIYNPVKVTDEFRSLAEAALSRHGYVSPIWLETSEEDPGTGRTREALAADVGLVIGAGGDGTIRRIANGLADTGVPLGLIPAGTGNLLARNLDLPLDEPAALEVALTGRPRTIDLVELTIDTTEPELFAVMAGVGLDAVIMDETNPDLKSTIGAGAYLVAAGKALGRLPMRVVVRVDDRRPMRRRAMLCLIGNVGKLQAGINLIADAQPDDGLLDVYIASPERLTHWIKIVVRMLTRRPQRDDRVDQVKGRKVSISIDRSDNYQLDGDVIGECRTMTAEVRPGALTVMVPA